MQQRKAAISMALSLLSDPKTAVLFQEGVPEAGLAALASGEKGEGSAIILGQADRIFFGSDSVTVLDYKSGHSADGEDTADTHIAQLAAYRLALQSLYPDRRIEAAILNTVSGDLTQADAQALDEMTARFNPQH